MEQGTAKYVIVRARCAEVFGLKDETEAAEVYLILSSLHEGHIASDGHAEHRALPMSPCHHRPSIAYFRSLAASRASRLASLNVLTASLPASFSFSWPR